MFRGTFILTPNGSLEATIPVVFEKIKVNVTVNTLINMSSPKGQSPDRVTRRTLSKEKAMCKLNILLC